MSKSQNNTLGQTPAEFSGSSAGEFQAIVNGLIGNIQTVTLVKIVKVKSQGVEPVGFVDVQPLVAQINQSGQMTAHGIIHNVPFFRLQGGVNAVILDPQVGDIGMCGFCSRDISSVKVNKRASPPQSRRKFDWADGLYFGGFLNGTPERYIQFHEGGIKIVAPDNIELIAPNIRLQSETPVQITGGVQSEKDVVAGGISVQEHSHWSGVGNTGKPHP